MNATDFEFDGPDDQVKRAPILHSIYFHDGEEAKLYPERCSQIDTTREFIDVEFGEDRALAGLEGFIWERLSRRLADVPLFETPVDCSKLSISSGTNSSLYTVLKILAEKGEHLLTRLF